MTTEEDISNPTIAPQSNEAAEGTAQRITQLTGALETARQLDKVLTILAGPSDERQQALRALHQEEVRADLEERAPQIKAAIQAEEWSTVEQWVNALSEEAHTESRYADLLAQVTATYQAHVGTVNLWAARQVHEVLNRLAPGNSEARELELTELEDTLRQQSNETAQRVQKLKEQESKLREQIAQDAEQRAKDKVFDEKLTGFRTQTSRSQREWEARKREGGAAVYSEILAEVKSTLWSSSGPYRDLSGSSVYQDWQAYLTQQQDWLEAQLNVERDSQIRLDDAQRQLAEVMRLANSFTPAELTAAQSTLRQVVERLDYSSPDQHRKRHGDLRASATTIGELLHTMAQDQVLPAVQITQGLVAELEKLQQNQKSTSNDLLEKIRAIGSAWGELQNRFGPVLWPQAKTTFLLLAKLDQQIAAWGKLYPLSEGGQSGVVVSISSAIKAVQEALTTTQTTITEHIDTSLKSLPNASNTAPSVVCLAARPEAIQAAMTTTQTAITKHIDDRLKTFQSDLNNHINANLKSFQTVIESSQKQRRTGLRNRLSSIFVLLRRRDQLTPSPESGQLDQQAPPTPRSSDASASLVSSRTPRQAALSGLALLLGVAALVPILILIGRSNQVSDLQAKNAILSTLVAQLSSTPTSTPESGATRTPTIPPGTPAPSATAPGSKTAISITVSPTEMSMPTPTSMPPISVDIPNVTVDWTRNVTLYDMPPLTLTAISGWVFTSTTTTLENGAPYTSLLATKGQQQVFTVTMVTTSTNQLVLTGTLELTDGVATWLPSVEAPPLSPGAYNIALRFENALGEQSWSGSYPLTVTKPLILISVDGDVRSFPKDQIGRKPNTVAKGGTLEAIGWVTNTLIFAKVRVPGSRTVWWVNVSQLSNVRATLEDGSPAEQSVKERLPQVPLPAEIAP